MTPSPELSRVPLQILKPKHMISRIEAFNYRCFDRLNIELGQYHVLAGANGTGKSTLLDIPLLLGEVLSRGLVPAFLESPSIAGSPRAQSLQELVHYGRGNAFGFAIEANLPEYLITNLLQYTPSTVPKDSQPRPIKVRYEIEFRIVNNIEIYVFQEILYIINHNLELTKNNSTVLGEKNNWLKIVERESGNPATLIPENHSSRISLRLEPQELALANIPRDVEKFPTAIWFRNLLEKGVMRYEPSWSMLRRACPPGQPQSLRSDAANLPWLVLNLQKQEPELLNSWVEHVKMALPNLTAIKGVQREEDYHAYLQLKYADNIVTSSGLSYGTLHILALTILPYLPQQSSLIFLEEPENGIHPRGIEVILQSLSSVYDSQIWVSTHSPVVLAHTDKEAVIVMRRSKENGAEAILGNQHPRLQDWQGKIDLGSLFAAGVLG
jgi:predicted ATPase